MNTDDYVAADGMFSILRTHGVRFYDPAAAGVPASATGYENEDAAELPVAAEDKEPEALPEAAGDPLEEG
jgi:hypothetical protein